MAKRVALFFLCFLCQWKAYADKPRWQNEDTIDVVRTVARNVIINNAFATFQRSQLPDGVRLEARSTVLTQEKGALFLSLIKQVESVHFTPTLDRIISHELREDGKSLIHAYSYYLRKERDILKDGDAFVSFRLALEKAGVQVN